MNSAHHESPKALLFDFGGVVLECDFGRVMKHWHQFSSLSLAEVTSRFEHDEPYAAHERGELSAEQYFDYLRDHLSLDASHEDMQAGWNAILVGPIAESLALVKAAATQLPCYAFTNTNATHQAVWENKFPGFLEPFTTVFVSSDMGCRKPERAAFDHIVSSIGVAAKEILFFDDLELNVTGAQDAGLRAVLVSGPQDVADALKPILQRQ